MVKELKSNLAAFDELTAELSADILGLRLIFDRFGDVDYSEKQNELMSLANSFIGRLEQSAADYSTLLNCFYNDEIMRV